MSKVVIKIALIVGAVGVFFVSTVNEEVLRQPLFSISISRIKSILISSELLNFNAELVVDVCIIFVYKMFRSCMSYFGCL